MIIEEETREAAGGQITKSLILLALIWTFAFAVNEPEDHGRGEVGPRSKMGLCKMGL